MKNATPRKSGRNLKMDKNKRIITVLIVISAMFLALLTFLLYFNMFEAQKVAGNPYNRRQWDDERYVTRGKIYDKSGLVLAESVEGSEGKTQRVYSQGKLYSHVIGYCSQLYGKSLLEQKYDSELLGKGDMSIFAGDKKKGFDLNLTIDNSIQKYAYAQMRSRRGALVAMNPKTGAIIAMVSLPDFDPSAEALEKEWGNIVENENSPLLARATGGLYPPGSTFKTVTAAGAYENGMAGRTFNDVGKFTAGSVTVDNYGKKAYGNITLERGFELSSNQVFCTVGYELGAENMLNLAERFGINSETEFDTPVSKSRIEYKKMTNTDGALVAIGQGQLLTTPLQMAVITSAIANGGEILRPFVVESITKNSANIKTAQKKVVRRATSTACADYITELMVNTVKKGTGTRAAISGITVAGKTGTAENETKKDHSWFVGFAPAEDPEIAVAVILEYDGSSGGQAAAPIAGSVIRKYLGK